MRQLQIASMVTATALIATLMVPLSLWAKESDAVFGVRDRAAAAQKVNQAGPAAGQTRVIQDY